MDAFYASVEQRDDPALRGLPVAVGGRPDQRGVVAAASYEARAFGVRSAMSMARAVRLCPSLVIVPPDFGRYRFASQAVFSIFREVTPLVEPLSLDEAYLDVTENAWGEPLATAVARRLKTRIRAETGLTASAGVAPNKFLAKIASGWKKPDGLTVISPDRVEPFLQQLPVDALWGVGPVTARRLRTRGIERLIDVRTADPQALRDTVGSLADWLRQLASGVDDRPVVPNRAAKSAGRENTYAEDLTDVDEMSREIAEMAADAARWLARKGLAARTVTIKVRYSDFTTITRSHSAGPTRDEADLVARAVQLLAKTEAGRRPVRLLGASVHNLCTDGAAERPAADWLPFAESDPPPAPLARENREAPVSDTWNPVQDQKFRREREQPALDLMALVQLSPDMRIVDLGCGTGRITRLLHERLGARETLGIDRSEKMLHAAGSDLPDGLQFEHGTIEAFDAVDRYDSHFLERGAALGAGSRLARPSARPRAQVGRAAGLPGPELARRPVSRGGRGPGGRGAVPVRLQGMAPAAAGTPARGVRAPALCERPGGTAGAPGRLPPRAAVPGGRARMDAGDAADGVRSPPAGRHVSAVSGALPEASARTAGAGGAVLLSVQADPLLGAERLTATARGAPAGARGANRAKDRMLKGTRDGILRRVQPISVHGQIAWDLYFTDADDPDGEVRVARVGPEAVTASSLDPGDRIRVEYLVGQAVKVTKVSRAS